MTAFARALIGCLVAGSLLAGCQSQTRLADGEPLPINTNDPATVYLELATSYMAQGQPGAALVNARKAVAVDAANAEAFIIQGMAQASLGHNEDAEKSFREAIQKAPDDSYATNAYGTFLCGQRRYEEAVAQFDAAVASSRNLEPWVAITNSALCLSDQGNKSAAETRFLKALQTNTRFGPALLGLARLHYASREYEQARTYVNRYFEASSPDPESLWLAYQIERALGNNKAAKSYALMLKSRYPDAPQTYRLMGL